MKKTVVGLLTAATMVVFVLTGVAFSQDTTNCANIGEGACIGCNKCTVGNIPCDVEVIDQQGETQDVTTYLDPFDFDGNGWKTGGFGAYGYCKKASPVAFNYAENNLRDCKFLFDVCECPDSCEIVPGTYIGIQMIVDVDGDYTTDDGVYFADPTLNTIYFDIKESNSLLCTRNAQDDTPTYTEMGEGEVYYDAAGNRIAYKKDAATIKEEVRNFGTIDYYKTVALERTTKDSKELCEITLSDKRTPLAGQLASPIAEGNKARALESQIKSDYMFNEIDGSGGHCWLWIDIPAIRIDPSKTDALKGKQIKVKVRILFNREIESICERCEPPNYCECELTVATICCGETSGSGCLFFPYLVQNIEDSTGWAAGVAITAREALPANAYAKLTLIDSAGNTATYTNNSVSRIWTFMMDDIISNFTGATIVPGAASLQVDTNYNVHGYSFLTDGKFGAGTLATGCATGKCCP